MIDFTVGKLIENQSVVRIDKKASVMDACTQMSQSNVRALIVTADNAMCGIVSERDVIRRCDAQGAPSELMRVEKIMTRDPITIGAQDSLASAMSFMLNGGFRHLPVVDAAGDVIGVVSMRDIPAEHGVMAHQIASGADQMAAE